MVASLHGVQKSAMSLLPNICVKSRIISAQKTLPIERGYFWEMLPNICVKSKNILDTDSQIDIDRKSLVLERFVSF